MDARTPAKKKKTRSQVRTKVVSEDANTKLFNFLKQNNMALSIQTLDPDVPFLGERGFALVDKEILVIKATYKS